jgi:chromosome segregation ATPase
MLIPEPVLDEDGVIANFEQISKALDDAHNQLIDKYNAAAKAGNEELTKEIEKQISKFDDYSKNLLDAAKRHDTLQSEIEETTNALEDLKDAIEDIQIAAYNAALDAAEE